MSTIQREALKAIAGDQTGMFAFCEIHGVYYHPMEPLYLTMGRIASWALLMKNDEIPATKIPTADGWESGKGWQTGVQTTPMSESGQV